MTFPGKRRLSLAALSLAAATVFVLGFAAPASASFTDPDVSECLEFTHSRPLIGRTQKLMATNRCRSKTHGFKVHNWSFISQETSYCIEVEPSRSGGWKWTKGRNHYEVISC
ncbi:hypothetical protein [Actinoplanes sp. HUAS TT8]|uniref:hypothetical protein n=1 Tax=Actinoplanes sp. HUAS TT8 TaxID=3447453 RepID=UPI003F5213A9